MIYSRAHKLFSLVISLSLLSSSIPLPAWGFAAGSSASQTTTMAAEPFHTETPALTTAGSGLPESAATPLVGDFDSLNMPAMVAEQQSTPTGESTAATALSVSRVQSAYAADMAIASTVILTFTVRNNRAPADTPVIDPTMSVTDTLTALAAFDYTADPNVVRNVVLTDRFLPPQAVVVASSPPADRDGEALVWNLGDIGPLDSVTATVTLAVPSSVSDFVDLDAGATAWGTLHNRLVSTTAGPARLAPDGFGDFLACTIDANCADPYVVAQAAALSNDPAAAFEYVRALGYESYTGSLRGARGTLWSAAGNSTDQASLLIALLRASGIPAGYRQGTLDGASRDALILSMFPQVGGLRGAIPDGSLVANPTADEQLIAEASNHWWVEAYLPGTGWTALDPAFASALPGDTFASPGSSRLAELPDNIRHKVTVRLKVEDYNILNIGGPLPGLNHSYPLSYTFRSVELIGAPVTLGHFVNSRAWNGLLFATYQHTFVPYLLVGDDDHVIEGAPYEELVTNWPLATTLLTGAWLEFELRSPDGVEQYERTLFDFIGYDARHNGGTIEVDATARTEEPVVSEQSTWTTLFAPSTISPDAVDARFPAMAAASQNAPATIEEIEAIAAGGNPTAAELARLQEAQQELTALARLSQGLQLLQFAAASDLGLEQMGQTFLVRPYYDTPRILTVGWEHDPVTDRSTIQFDLRQNRVRAVAYPGQAWRALQAFHFARGVTEATLEGSLLEQFGEAQVVSVYHVFEAARAANMDFALITPGNVADLVDLPLSAEAKARIATTLRDPAKIVYVPTGMVTLAGEETVGWYQIDVISGETIDVMENGQHQALVEYVSILNSGLQEYAFAIIGFAHGFSVYSLSFTGHLLSQLPLDGLDLKTAWVNASNRAVADVTRVAEAIGFAVTLVGGCFEGFPPIDDALGWISAYVDGAGYEFTIEVDIGEVISGLDDLDDMIDIPGYIECLEFPVADDVTVGGDIDDIRLTVSLSVGGFVDGANFAKSYIDNMIDPPLP